MSNSNRQHLFGGLYQPNASQIPTASNNPQNGHRVGYIEGTTGLEGTFFLNMVKYLKTGKIPPTVPDKWLEKLKTSSPRYTLKDGVLYSKIDAAGQNNFRLVVPDNEDRLRLIRKCHVENDTAYHNPQKRTSDLIKNTYFWEGMDDDINKFIADCHPCNTRVLPLKSIKISDNVIWKIIEIEITGPYHDYEDSSKFWYLLHITDLLTKWFVLEPFTEFTPGVISMIFMKHFKSIGERWGTPVAIRLVNMYCEMHEEVNNLVNEMQKVFAGITDGMINDPDIATEDIVRAEVIVEFEDAALNFKDIDPLKQYVKQHVSQTKELLKILVFKGECSLLDKELKEWIRLIILEFAQARPNDWHDQLSMAIFSDNLRKLMSMSPNPIHPNWLMYERTDDLLCEIITMDQTLLDFLDLSESEQYSEEPMDDEEENMSINDELKGEPLFTNISTLPSYSNAQDPPDLTFTDTTSLFSCQECPFKSPLQFRYQLHIATHEAPDYLCEICNTLYPLRSVLALHMVLKHKYICNEINFNYQSLSYFTCNECPFVTWAEKSLDEHTRKCHKKKFSCNHCGQVIIGESNLQTHLLDVHDSQIKSQAYIKCPHCTYEFNNGRALFEHVKYRHDLDMPEHTCPYCLGQPHANLADFKEHMLIHTGFYQYTCGICSNTYKHMSNANRHSFKDHPNQPVVINTTHNREAPQTKFADDETPNTDINHIPTNMNPDGRTSNKPLFVIDRNSGLHYQAFDHNNVPLTDLNQIKSDTKYAFVSQDYVNQFN